MKKWWTFHVNEVKALREMCDMGWLEAISFHLVGRHVYMWWARLGCKWFGHDYTVYADAENGSEDVSCNRCGYHHHVYF